MKFILVFFIILSIKLNASSTIDFIYTNANSGQSSGGHSAIRFGDTVFHFQYHEDKIFHLERETWKEYYKNYSLIDNRSSIIYKINVNQKIYEDILYEFNKEYILREQELEKLSKLEKDSYILKKIVTQKILDLDYFEYLSPNKNEKLYSNLEFDRTYLLKKIINFRNQLKSTEEYLEKNKSEVSVFDNFYTTDSEELQSIQNQIFLLESIYNKLDLKQENLISNSKILLTQKDKVNLENELRKLEIELLEEINGEISFITTEKYLQYLLYKKIIQENQFYYFRISAKEYIDKEKIDSDYLEKIKSNLNKTDFFDQSISVIEKIHLFTKISNLKLELEKTNVIGLKFDFKLDKKKEIYYSKLSEKNLVNSVKNLNLYKEFLQKKYPFDLIRENCTTEIFKLLNKALKSEEESISKLGGYISEKELLSFIPFLAGELVNKRYRVIKIEFIQSYRNQYLEKLNFLERVIESNTITSRKYKANKQDFEFIFFTDNSIYTRPVLGFVNLIFGFSMLPVSVFYLPVDRGQKLIKNTQSIFFSLPELIFFNIRKGFFYHNELE